VTDQAQHKTLRIRTSIGLVVAGCGIGGLVLATVLAVAWSGVDRRTEKLSVDTAAIVDLRRLDDELSAWATKVDLVLGSGQTWFMEDLERAADRLHRILERMKFDAFQTLTRDLVSYIDVELARLHAAVIDFGDGRADRMDVAHAESVSEFGPLLERFHRIDREIQLLLELQRSELASAHKLLSTVSWAATLLYLLFLSLLWRWSASRITRPLVELAEATRQSMETGAPLSVDPTGPREVRMLTASVQAMTGTLEDAVQSRTADIESMADLRRVVFDTVPLPLAHVGADGTLLGCNRACEQFFAVDRVADVLGRPVRDLPLGVVMDFGAGEHPLEDGHGRKRIVNVVMADVPRARGIVVCLIDVTDRVAQERTLRSMLSELDHRVRNTLAAIQTLVDMETRSGQVGDGDLSGRIQSMARAHDLLAASRGESVELGEAVDVILRPWLADCNVQTTGPRVEMRPDRSMPICMVLNELVTNSLKYGAASQPGGCVDVTWTERAGDVTLDWVESGGPPIAAPSASSGTGIGLMRGLVQHQLQGTLTLDWRAEGLRARIQVQA